MGGIFFSPDDIRAIRQESQLTRQMQASLKDQEDKMADFYEIEAAGLRPRRTFAKETSGTPPTLTSSTDPSQSNALSNKAQGEYSGVGIITKGKGRPACPRKAPAESPPLPYRGIKNPDNRYCFLISAVQLLSSFPKLPAFLRNWASARPPRSMIGPQMTAISAIINTMAELRPQVKSSSQEFQPISCAWFRYPVVLRSTLPSPDLHDGGDTGLAARGLLLLLRDAGPSFLPRGVSMESWLPHVVSTSSCQGCSTTSLSSTWALPLSLSLLAGDRSPFPLSELVDRWLLGGPSESFRCAHCGGRQGATTRTLQTHAECLLLDIHRPLGLQNLRSLRSAHHNISVLPSLVLDHRWTQDGQPASYSLQSVICIQMEGNARSRQLPHAFLLDRNSSGEWVKCDDDSVSVLHNLTACRVIASYGVQLLFKRTVSSLPDPVAVLHPFSAAQRPALGLSSASKTNRHFRQRLRKIIRNLRKMAADKKDEHSTNAASFNSRAFSLLGQGMSIERHLLPRSPVPSSAPLGFSTVYRVYKQGMREHLPQPSAKWFSDFKQSRDGLRGGAQASLAFATLRYNLERFHGTNVLSLTSHVREPLLAFPPQKVVPPTAPRLSQGALNQWLSQMFLLSPSFGAQLHLRSRNPLADRTTKALESIVQDGSLMLLTSWHALSSPRVLRYVQRRRPRVLIVRAQDIKGRILLHHTANFRSETPAWDHAPRFIGPLGISLPAVRYKRLRTILQLTMLFIDVGARDGLLELSIPEAPFGPEEFFRPDWILAKASAWIVVGLILWSPQESDPQMDPPEEQGLPEGDSEDEEDAITALSHLSREERLVQSIASHRLEAPPLQRWIQARVDIARDRLERQFLSLDAPVDSPPSSPPGSFDRFPGPPPLPSSVEEIIESALPPPSLADSPAPPLPSSRSPEGREARPDGIVAPVVSGSPPLPLVEPKRWTQAQRDSFQQCMEESMRTAQPPQASLKQAIQAAVAAAPIENDAAPPAVPSLALPSVIQDAQPPPPPLSRRQPRPPKSRRKITKVPRMLTALQSITRGLQRQVPRDPGSHLSRLWMSICRTLRMEGDLVGHILDETSSDDPLELSRLLPDALKVLAKARRKINSRLEDIKRVKRESKRPDRFRHNQAFDRNQHKFLLRVQADSAMESPPPEALREHYADLYRTRVSDLADEERRLHQVMGPGATLWTPPEDSKYNQRELLLGSDRLRAPILRPGEVIDKGHFTNLVFRGNVDPAPLSLLPSETESVIQSSAEVALQAGVEGMRSLMNAHKAPSLRQYTVQFPPEDDNERRPNRNSDELKRWDTANLPLQDVYTAPPVDLVPKLMEFLEAEAGEYLGIHLPNGEDTRGLIIRLQSNAFALRLSSLPDEFQQRFPVARLAPRLDRPDELSPGSLSPWDAILVTDGSCFPEHGNAAGFGAFLFYNRDIIAIYGNADNPASSGEQEVLAVMAGGLQFIREMAWRPRRVHVYTDYRALSDANLEGEAHELFKTRSKPPLWDAIFRFHVQTAPISFHWVKSHQERSFEWTFRLNECADRLAKWAVLRRVTRLQRIREWERLRSAPPRDSNGRLLLVGPFQESHIPGDRVKQFVNIFKCLPPPLSREQALDLARRPLSLGEIEHAIQAKKGPAPGDDGIPPDIFKLLSQDAKIQLGSFFSHCWKEKRLPKDWKPGILSQIWKGTGTGANVSDWRGITVSNAILNLYEKLVTFRVESFKLHTGCIRKTSKANTTTVSGCDEWNMVLRLMLADLRAAPKITGKKKTLIIFSTDIRKAFDRAELTYICEAYSHVVAQEGEFPELFAFLRHRFKDSPLKLKVPDSTGKSAVLPDEIHRSRGIPQGGSLSPGTYGVLDEYLTRLCPAQQFMPAGYRFYDGTSSDRSQNTSVYPLRPPLTADHKFADDNWAALGGDGPPELYIPEAQKGFSLLYTQLRAARQICAAEKCSVICLVSEEGKGVYAVPISLTAPGRDSTCPPTVIRNRSAIEVFRSLGLHTDGNNNPQIQRDYAISRFVATARLIHSLDLSLARKRKALTCLLTSILDFSFGWTPFPQKLLRDLDTAFRDHIRETLQLSPQEIPNAVLYGPIGGGGGFGLHQFSTRYYLRTFTVFIKCLLSTDPYVQYAVDAHLRLAWDYYFPRNKDLCPQRLPLRGRRAAPKSSCPPQPPSTRFSFRWAGDGGPRPPLMHPPIHPPDIWRMHSVFHGVEVPTDCIIPAFYPRYVNAVNRGALRDEAPIPEDINKQCPKLPDPPDQPFLGWQGHLHLLKEDRRDGLMVLHWIRACRALGIGINPRIPPGHVSDSSWPDGRQQRSDAEHSLARFREAYDVPPARFEWNALEVPVVLSVTNFLTKETVAPGSVDQAIAQVKKNWTSYNLWKLRQRCSEDANKFKVAPRFGLTWGIRSEIRRPFQAITNHFLQPNGGLSVREVAIVLKCQLDVWPTPARVSTVITKGATSTSCPYGCRVTGSISHYLLSKSSFHSEALKSLLDQRHSKCRQWIRSCLERSDNDDGIAPDCKVFIIGEEGAFPRPKQDSAPPRADAGLPAPEGAPLLAPPLSPAFIHPAAQVMVDMAGPGFSHKIDLLVTASRRSNHVTLIDYTTREDQWLVREDDSCLPARQSPDDRRDTWDRDGRRVNPPYRPKDPNAFRGEDPPSTWPAIPWKSHQAWGYNPRAIYDHRYLPLEEAISRQTIRRRPMSTNLIMIAMGARGYISQASFDELCFHFSKSIAQQIYQGLTRICHEHIIQTWNFLHHFPAGPPPNPPFLPPQ